MDFWNKYKCRIISITLVSMFMVWLVVIGIWGFGVATAGLYGKGEAMKQVQSAEFRLEAYNYFYNQCASIQSLEGRIDELTAQLNQFQSGTREYYYTVASLTGTKSLRHEAIATYNADARKEYTEGQFRDSDLPYQIPDNGYPLINGGKTQCNCGR